MRYLAALFVFLCSSCTCSQDLPNTRQEGYRGIALQHSSVVFDEENRWDPGSLDDVIPHWKKQMDAGETVLYMYSYYDKNFQNQPAQELIAAQNMQNVLDYLVSKGLDSKNVITSIVPDTYIRVTIIEYPKNE